MQTEDPGHTAALQEAWESSVRAPPLATPVGTPHGHFHPSLDGLGGSEKLTWVLPAWNPGENRSGKVSLGQRSKGAVGGGGEMLAPRAW